MFSAVEFHVIFYFLLMFIYPMAIIFVRINAIYFFPADKKKGKRVFQVVCESDGLKGLKKKDV